LSDAIRQGADDFLVQPIDFDELKLRLQCSLAHRPRTGTSNSLTIECGPLKLDLDTNEIFLEDAYLDLTPRERGVLSVLMKNCNKVTSKDQIAGQIFTLDEQVETRTIETYVYRLRKKLAHPDLELATMRGLGYRLSSKSSQGT
ncbi:MAG: response regulator transcription factor, partial [Pseudomonadota bacterium]